MRGANEVARADQGGADRRAQPLGEADRDAVERRGDVARRDALLDRRVEEAGAVEMGGQATPLRQRRRRFEIGGRQHLAAERVLEAEQPALREVRVLGLDRRLDARQRDRAVGLVLERLRLDAAERRRAAAFPAIGVRHLADDVFVAAAAVRHDRHQVALRAAGDEERRFLAEHRGDLFLQRVDARVVAEDVVAHGRFGHRRAHRRGWPGHGVAAQVHCSHLAASRKVLQHRVTVLAEDRFGMELHAFERCRGGGESAVPNAHDLTVARRRRHLEGLGQAVARDRQRVIANHREALRQRGVDAAPVVRDLVDLAVHEARRAHDLAAERRADRLVAEADAEDRQLAGEGLDRGDAHARLGRRARARRQDQRRRRQGSDAGDVDLVVAEHLHVGAELAEVLHQVEGEAVVVVDHQQHGGLRADAGPQLRGHAAATAAPSPRTAARPMATSRHRSASRMRHKSG